ncbi:MAG: hypothetical protein IT488_13505, partial [Gammaproteobacteria bacterium]|nr:hypothetical protein [Gammaproteobacteria bacterium]
SHQFINTTLKKDNLRHSIKITLQGIPYSSGGASDLFSRFIWYNDSPPYEKVLFTTTGLYEQVREHYVDTPVLLRQFISARQFFSRFSQTDIARLDRGKLKEVYGFYQPYGTKIATADELRAALKAGILAPLRTSKRSPDGMKSNPG